MTATGVHAARQLSQLMCCTSSHFNCFNCWDKQKKIAFNWFDGWKQCNSLHHQLAFLRYEISINISMCSLRACLLHSILACDDMTEQSQRKMATLWEPTEHRYVNFWNVLICISSYFYHLSGNKFQLKVNISHLLDIEVYLIMQPELNIT